MSVGDYLDDILDGAGIPAIARNGGDAPIPPVAPVPVKARKVRFTVQVSEDIVEELRNAAVFLLMAGEPATIAGLVETALLDKIEALRAEHCDGRPFPVRPYQPPVGRRLLREPS